MRALVDRHHGDLFYSLQLLGDRLGIEVYTPVGHEWWDNGYWRFGQNYGDDRLAGQFLVTPFLERDENHDVYDPAHPERAIHTVTFDEFVNLSWDFVVATVDDNQHGFARLAKEWGAQYVLQVGNTRQYIDWNLDPLALVSAEAPILGRGVRYHQEFDSDGVFGYREPTGNRRISSYVNLATLIPETAPILAAYKAELSEFDWRIHGIECPDGIVKPIDAIAQGMADSMWGYHSKPTGDGMGHVIHGWAASGRPLIGHASFYRGQMAEPFWVDGETCIDLDRRSFAENVALVREVSADPDRHREMCLNMRAVFDATVHYDEEAAAVAALLGVREPVAV